MAAKFFFPTTLASRALHTNLSPFFPPPKRRRRKKAISQMRAEPIFFLQGGRKEGEGTRELLRERERRGTFFPLDFWFTLVARFLLSSGKNQHQAGKSRLLFLQDVCLSFPPAPPLPLPLSTSSSSLQKSSTSENFGVHQDCQIRFATFGYFYKVHFIIIIIRVSGCV